MTGFREWATAVFGEEAGNDLADRCADALGRTLDQAVFHGTTPAIQENEMNQAQITEVSMTVDSGLAQEELADLTEAERLGLIVGAAYGRALADRDMARAELQEALGHLEAVLHSLPAGSFALTNVAQEAAQEFIQRIKKPAPVDSTQTPAQEDR